MRHAVIWGRRRQGKSTLALALALASGRKPVVIFDPCEQFRNFASGGPGDLALIENALVRGEPEIVRYRVMGDPESEFSHLMELLDGGNWAWGDYSLIVDESSQLQRAQGFHPAIARLIRQAPDDVLVVQTLHRPSETHPTVRALCTDYFFFQTFLQRDLEVIAGNYGPEVARAVSRLAPYEVLHFWLGDTGAPKWKVWNDPKLWFVDLRSRDESEVLSDV